MSDAHLYYTPSVQPANSVTAEDYAAGIAFANENFSSDEIIEKLYEPLRARNPESIRREHIGQDSSGELSMWAYIFTPTAYTHTVYIQAGVHGRNELQGYMALYRMLSMMYDPDCADQTLRFLRERVRFFIVPMVNVWDITMRARNLPCFSPFIRDNVNLNRSWTKDTPVKEIRNIQHFIAKYKDEIDFAIDQHTDPGGGSGGYLFVYPEGMDPAITGPFHELLNALYIKNGLTIKRAYRGDDKNYPLYSRSDVNTEPDYPRQDLSTSCSSGIFYDFHIPAVTAEHGDRHFSPHRGDAMDMTRALEQYTNFVLTFVKTQAPRCPQRRDCKGESL